MLARFGLFEDSVRPTHSNRLEVAKREWRTSLIDSFASNLAFALFDCKEGPRVAAYVQERPVKVLNLLGVVFINSRKPVGVSSYMEPTGFLIYHNENLFQWASGTGSSQTAIITDDFLIFLWLFIFSCPAAVIISAIFRNLRPSTEIWPKRAIWTKSANCNQPV